MATTVRVTFPWGRYHGTPWGRHPNEGAVEWPPSPWRLLRALYAVWQIRCRDLDEAVVVSALTKLASQPSYRGPQGRVAHARHWLPDDDHTALKYRKSMALDTFVALPDQPLWITWPTVLTQEERSAVNDLVTSLSYLGRAESLCEATLVDEAPSASEAEWVPTGTTADDVDPGDLTELLSPATPLDIESLITAPSRWRRSKRLQPEYTTFAPYRVVSHAAAHSGRRPRRPRRTIEAVRLHLTGPARPPSEHAVVVAHLMRAAAMSRFDGQSGVFSGRDAAGRRTDDHTHAHYLAYCSEAAAYGRADHRAPLDTIVVWAPEGLDDAHLDALSRVRRLRPPDHVRGVAVLDVAIEVIGTIADAAPELVGGEGGSCRWTSLTPFVPGRYARRITFDEHVSESVVAELAWRGLPRASVAVRNDPHWRRFRRHRPDGSSQWGARPGRFVDLVFNEPQAGPLALGALSHFGLGLFVAAM